MHTWTAMRKKLEETYLAESLRGRLTYFVTNYHRTHDRDEGRVALRLDGAEILKSNFFDYYDKRWAAYQARKQAETDPDQSTAWTDSALDAYAAGEFYQRSFYRAFREFDGQSIAQSLVSENALVRMLALLDRRTGKRTLVRLRTHMQTEPQWLQMIWALRCSAEGIPADPAEETGCLQSADHPEGGIR